jgi:hypothetical protein
LISTTGGKHRPDTGWQKTMLPLAARRIPWRKKTTEDFTDVIEKRLMAAIS